MSNSNSFGKALYSALRDREPIGPLSEQDSTLTVDDAYAISLEFLALRQKDGERVIGKKIGVTSKAVQDMLGVFKFAAGIANPDYRRWQLWHHGG
ncbi:MAG: hypothetical protein IPP45_10635 [Sphingomonadales bacterium]|nr:hypothetical protein [Sphingomonadales bacterium]